MAVINKYLFGSEEAIVPVTLTALDTVAVNLAKKVNLYIDNQSGGPLTINVLGDTATTTNCAGVGDIDLTGGKDFVVADTELFQIPLNTKYKDWLGDGNLTITGGLAATAWVVEV